MRVDRSTAQRAQQLSEVCLSVYGCEGSSIHLPLASDNTMVVVLRAILGKVERGSTA